MSGRPTASIRRVYTESPLPPTTHHRASAVRKVAEGTTPEMVRGTVDTGSERHAPDGGADRTRRPYDCRCAILPRGQDWRVSDEEVAVERWDGVACRLLG